VPNGRRTDPKRYAPVGAVRWCTYWSEFREVLSHNANGTVTERVLQQTRTSGKRQPFTLESYGMTSPYDLLTHRTPLDPLDHVYLPRDYHVAHVVGRSTGPNGEERRRVV
jgi:hypothetical protein